MSAAGEPTDTHPTRESQRARLAIAGGLALALAVVVAVIAVAGGADEKRTWAAAPADCIEKWNRGLTNARALGRHQYITHGYNEVRIARLAPDNETLLENAAEPEGRCVVIFAATELDPERASLGQYYTRLGWRPLSDVTRDEVITRMHVEAFTATNAELLQRGSIEPLEAPEGAETRTARTEA